MAEPTLGEMGRADALDRMVSGRGILGVEELSLTQAAGRVLAAPVRARSDQPPFRAAAMDGYAVGKGPLDGWLRVVGESAAGRPYTGAVAAGEAVRIFTGAVVPEGLRVVVQERAVRDGVRVRFDAGEDTNVFVRERGADFMAGATLLEPGVRLDPWRMALAGAAGVARLTVARRPRVAVLSTGEEILAAGAEPAPGKIFDSAGPGIAALLEAEGAAVEVLSTAGDDIEAIVRAVSAAKADLLVTIGGASVGDHDLVKPALATLGLSLAVPSVRLRPGKPTWFGALPGAETAPGLAVLGLPGNPASALVCGALFAVPLVRALQGAPPEPVFETLAAEGPLPPNGGREHFMRARIVHGPDGARLRPAADQDSSLVTVFAAADALLMRPIGAPASTQGSLHPFLRLARL